MGRQIDQRGEVMLQDGVRYGPGNVPRTTMALHRGRHMKDVSLVRKRGDTVEVTQRIRNAPNPWRHARLVLVSAKHFKLKYGIERKRTQATDDNCATIEALSQVERQHQW